MSFALEVKKEIVSNENLSEEKKKALLSGFIRYNGELIFYDGKIGLKMTSISNFIIRSFYTMIKSFYNCEIEISIIESKILKKNKIYTLFLKTDVKKILKDLDVYNWEIGKKILNLKTEVLENSDLFWAYISGLFVACGSVNDPETSNYHLELQVKENESADFVIAALETHKFNFKKIEKKNRTVCYIKRSNNVSDFLIKMSAVSSALKFEAVRTERDIKNQLNRFLNIELHNSQLAIKAAEKQVEMILAIKAAGKFNLISSKAQVLADLRLENPSSSFNELVELMEENEIIISKPGINYLFNNIKKVYEKIRGN